MLLYFEVIYSVYHTCVFPYSVPVSSNIFSFTTVQQYSKTGTRNCTGVLLLYMRVIYCIQESTTTTRAASVLAAAPRIPSHCLTYHNIRRYSERNCCCRFGSCCTGSCCYYRRRAFLYLESLVLEETLLSSPCDIRSTIYFV